MVQPYELTNLKEEWHLFLISNAEARFIVDGMMERTGLNESDVLFQLIGIWAEQNLTVQQRPVFDDWVFRSTAMN